MAKTALDLTPEELSSYRPGRMSRESDVMEIGKRWDQGWDVARKAAHLLRERFGANRIVAFGSLVHRDWFNPRSDIDLVAWGIPADQFYRAVAAVTGISPDFEVNLADPDDCGLLVRKAIEREGIDL